MTTLREHMQTHRIDGATLADATRIGGVRALALYLEGKGPPPPPSMCAYHQVFVHLSQSERRDIEIDVEQERTAWRIHRESQVVAAPVYDR